MEQIYTIKNNVFLEIGEWEKYNNLYFSEDLKIFSDSKFPNRDSSIFYQDSNYTNAINRLEDKINELQINANRKII